MDSASDSWFSSLTNKLRETTDKIKETAVSLYSRAKSNVTSLQNNDTSTPTPTGGAKKRRSKRVRFSKRRKVYKYKTIRKRK